MNTKTYRSKEWYKYQYYNPHDKRSDDFGFVHFESRHQMEKYIKKLEKEKK
jgi:hypothetical protein